MFQVSTGDDFDAARCQGFQDGLDDTFMRLYKMEPRPTFFACITHARRAAAYCRYTQLAGWRLAWHFDAPRGEARQRKRDNAAKRAAR